MGLTRRTLLTAAALSLLGCGGATPDLDALTAFYDEDNIEARKCLQYANHVSEAYDLIVAGTAAEAIPRRIVALHREEARTPKMESELTRVAAAAAGIASSFYPLDKQATLVAYMQICRHQVFGTSFDADPRRVRDAERCVRTFPLGDKRQNCVARVFDPTQRYGPAE